MVRIAIACFAVVALALFALARGQSGSVVSAPTLGENRAPVQLAGQVTVFAAASLTDAFTEIGERFKADNPGSDVTFNFGASSQLFVQIDQGAPADVFASADQVQMDRAKNAGRIDGPDATFAMNRLVIIVPAGNPGRITSVGDLSRPGLRLVTSQQNVPIGVYTQNMLEAMSRDPQYGSTFKDQVNANIVSLEDNVRQIVAKVALGEADGGVVYRTDVTPQVASQVAVVDIPDELNTLPSYPIATVQGGPNRTGAAAFTALVLSPTGQSILAKWGFTPVGPTAAEPDARVSAFAQPGHVDQQEAPNAALASGRRAL